MRILHVTEAMGGGVVTLLNSISRRQSDSATSVEVWYTERSETPSPEALQSKFDPRVRLRSWGSRGHTLSLFRSLRAAYRSNEFDVVHLHSSIAGLVGRIAKVGVATDAAIFYSPHGFGFLRTNKSRLINRATLLVERTLSPIGAGLILTSASERSLAVRLLKASASDLLQTGVDSSTVRVRMESSTDKKRLVVGMVGRVSFQKAPWRFASVARALSGDARFIWVGDGDQQDVERWLGGSSVEVTGWVDADHLAALIDSFDVFLFPSLWEGMALSLIQAQAQGVPAVTSDAVGNVDTVRDGYSGFVCSTDQELIDATRRLLNEPSLREAMSFNALEWARTSLTDDAIGTDSIAIYARSVFASPSSTLV